MSIASLMRGGATESRGYLRGPTATETYTREYALPSSSWGVQQGPGRRCDNVNRLRVEYRKVKDKLNKSGEESITAPEWFDSLDAVLGTRPATKPSLFSFFEVNCLIDVWGSDRIHKLFAGTHRNRDVYQRVSTSRVELGCAARTWEKVRGKVNRLRVGYRKVKDKLNKSGEGSGTIPEWFNSIDAVLGTRPATKPPCI